MSKVRRMFCLIFARKTNWRKIVPFTDEEKQKTKNSYDALSKQALRVLAFAERDMEGIQENQASRRSR
jgi:magnesium-transporting ATPase (P-type)